MAFFKSFQQSLPSVSSILDSVTNAVDDLASVVGDVTYTVSDHLAEQVTSIMSKVQADREEQEQAAAREAMWRAAQAGMPNVGSCPVKQQVPSGDPEAYNANYSLCSTETPTEAEPLQPTTRRHLGEGRRQIRKTGEGENGGDKEEEEEDGEGSLSKSQKESKYCQDHAAFPSERRASRGESPNSRDKSLASKESSSSSIRKAKAEKEVTTSISPKIGPKGNHPSSKETATLGGKTRTYSSRTRKGNEDRDSSESEDEGTGKHLESLQQRPRKLYRPLLAEYEGYSSEASSVDTKSVPRVSHRHHHDERQPPPYQDGEGTPHLSPTPSGMGFGREDQRYLTKGYEDLPRGSVVILSPEDSPSAPGSGQFPVGYEPEPLAKYGTLDVAFDYDSREQRLAVTVTAATDIPALRSTGNVSWQVHLVLLPTKKQRAKTGVRKGPCPVFTETFGFSPVEQDALGSYAVRFRLYSVRRMKKERVLGEKVFFLTKLNLEGKLALPVTLDPGCTLPGCGSLVSMTRSEGTSPLRTAGQSSTARILLGLVYNATTGRLSVEVVKGNHFKNMAADKPSSGIFCCLKHLIGGEVYIIRDTYVKLTMLNSVGHEMSKCKTSISRGHPDPTYEETFMFQVALFQLSEVTLVLSVHSKRSGVRRRNRLGWVSLGLNSSSEEEFSHWTQMKEMEGEQVCRWHSLVEA